MAVPKDYRLCIRLRGNELWQPKTLVLIARKAKNASALAALRSFIVYRFEQSLQIFTYLSR
jgi:hypothetical protein